MTRWFRMPTARVCSRPPTSRSISSATRGATTTTRFRTHFGTSCGRSWGKLALSDCPCIKPPGRGISPRLSSGGDAMFRPLSFIAVALSAAVASADAPRFKFQKGDTLAYHLVQTTNVTESVPDEKTNKPIESAVATKVDLVRHWKVTDVDAAGVATLEMSIVSMRWERKTEKDEDV